MVVWLVLVFSFYNHKQWNTNNTSYQYYTCCWYMFYNGAGFILCMKNLEKYGIQLSVFKVMNSMKFRVAVWKSMDFVEFCVRFLRAVLNFCMQVYFSCNLMKSLSEFCWNWLKLKLNIKIQGIPPNYQIYSGIFI